MVARDGRSQWHVVLLPVTAVLLLATAAVADFSGVTVTNESDAAVFNNGATDGEERNSTTSFTAAATTISSRYAWIVAADSGIFTDSSISMHSQYRINFTATAPGAYQLAVTTGWHGSMTTVDDTTFATVAATANVDALTGTPTGGTLASGSLNFVDPGSRTSGSTGQLPFDVTGAAVISGVSNGVGQAHQLRFQWNNSCSSPGSGSFVGGDECAVRGGLASMLSGQTAGSYPGEGGRIQANDGHFVVVTLTSFCGNGTVDAGVGEQCDQGAANGTAGSCCTAGCQIRTAGEQCRAPADLCDQAEFCNGSSPTCPANIFLPMGTVCRAASPGQICDEVEVCTGTGASCPTDQVLPNGTPCRGSAGVCDLAEVCDGSSKFCPADMKSTAPCRASAGVCDNAESCDGVNDNCPADGFKSAATPCRGAAGVCDMAENCPGNGPNCPADIVKPSGTACPADGNPCTVDQCDGSSTACQHPAGNSGALCRPDVGDCDVAEFCTGASTSCPADGFEPNGTTCTSDGNPCTVDECNGSGTCQHPAGNSGTQCRAAVDACDVAETCDGTSTTCPPDAIATNGTVCRAASPGQLCDEDELCDGSSTACPADAVKTSGTECRAVAGSCDVAEQCDGVGKLCPPDTLLSSSTECRASTGICDPAENCTGSSAACPADILSSSATPCRPSTGVCDIAENCTGSSGACPIDVVQPDGTDCGDGLFCNGSEACASGACQSSGPPCSMSQSCDEASDLCFSGSCPGNAVICRTAQKSLLLIRDKTDNNKDKLVWKWIKGASTSQPEFADPTSTATYALCFYSGASQTLIGSAVVPPSNSKWSPIGSKGYKYKDIGGFDAGIQKITLKGSTANKSKALVKGKGALLPDFTLPFQPTDLPIMVQLRNNQTGICWGSTFATPKKNVAGQFKAKTP